MKQCRTCKYVSNKKYCYRCWDYKEYARNWKQCVGHWAAAAIGILGLIAIATLVAAAISQLIVMAVEADTLGVPIEVPGPVIDIDCGDDE